MLKPKEVSYAMMAFPAQVVGDYLPKLEDIPEELLADYLENKSDKWIVLCERVFFDGAKGLEFFPKEGIDPALAWRHISACLRSFQPKHEHKIAGCAYLCSLWFEDFRWQKEREEK